MQLASSVELPYEVASKSSREMRASNL